MDIFIIAGVTPQSDSDLLNLSPKVSKKLHQRCQCYYNTGPNGLIHHGAEASLTILNINHTVLPSSCYGAIWSSNLPKALKRKC